MGYQFPSFLHSTSGLLLRYFLFCDTSYSTFPRQNKQEYALFFWPLFLFFNDLKIFLNGGFPSNFPLSLITAQSPKLRLGCPLSQFSLQHLREITLLVGTYWFFKSSLKKFKTNHCLIRLYNVDGE